MNILKSISIALIILFSALSLCYAQDATDLFNEGLESASAGNFKKAHEAFKKVLETEKYPSAIETVKRYLQITDDALAQKIKNETGLYLFKGIVSSRMFALDKAITEWKKALELNPDYIITYRMLWGAYAGKNMHDDSIDMLKKIIEINPNDAEAHFNLASTYYFDKQYKLAIEHCDKAKKLGLEDPELSNLLGRLEQYR